MTCGRSQWLRAYEAAAEHGSAVVEAIADEKLGFRMPASEAVKAAQELLNAAANALNMNLTLDASPVPSFLRCRRANSSTPSMSDVKSASAACVINGGNAATRNIERSCPASENNAHE